MRIKEFLKSIKGLSPNTHRSYRQTLWNLHAKIAGGEPTDKDITDYLSRYQTSSLHRHKAAIKAYIEFTGRPWPFTSRQFRVSRRKVPKFVKPELIPKIAALGTKDDEMFIMTLFTLGCRISELMGITQEDITENGVLVIGKGDHQALIPAVPEFLEKLRHYAKSNRRAKVFPEKYSHYYERLRFLGEKAGIPGLHPHMLRSSRAVDLLNKNMPLPYVQQMLRHANLNTTAIYLEISNTDLGAQLEKVEKYVEDM